MATSLSINARRTFCCFRITSLQIRNINIISSHQIFGRLNTFSVSNSNLTNRRISTGKIYCSNNMSSSKIIAAIQMTSTEDKESNISRAVDMIEEAVKNNAKVVFLPEAFDFIGRNKEEIAILSEPLDGPLIQRLRNKAKDLKVWLLLGGFHEKLDTVRQDGKPWLANSHVAINDQGEIASVYRKTHLFDVVIPEHNIDLQESSYIKAGEKILKPVTTPVGNIGLGICYDIRFPEFSLQLRRLGSEIITYPSAFTVVTGKAHWQILLCARAIETQCYVVAAAQVGKHNPKRESYGNSMIVNSWGEIVAHATTNTEQVIYATVDHSQIQEKRRNMPVKNHRRYDLYGAETFSLPSGTLNEIDHVFGQVTIKGKFIFLQSRFSFASVNKKCVVPGHVLVIPKRCVPRVTDMTPVEMADLAMLAQKVGDILDSFYGTTSSTMAIQDGPLAGQSIKHVHMHVLPRKEGDFKKNDDIYVEMEKHDKGEVLWREEEEMLNEANAIRHHISTVHPDILSEC